MNLEAYCSLNHVVIDAVALVVVKAQEIGSKRETIEDARVSSGNPKCLANVLPTAERVAEVDVWRYTPKILGSYQPRCRGWVRKSQQVVGVAR